MAKKILCKLRACKKFKTCKQKTDPFKNGKLCWGYENYINQDIPKNLKQYEVLFSEINLNLERINVRLFEPLPTNKKKEIIKMFFFGKSNINDIAEYLQCSPQYIYTILKNCKNILLDSIKK
jgi:DNA-directed RNA polymerase specialized sigma subunit